MWMSQFLRREIAAAVWAAATCVSWPCACACACASTSASAIMSPIWNEAKRSRIGERMGSETRQLQDFLRWMNGAARCGGGDPEGCGGMEKDEKKERDGRTRTELESCWAGGTTTHATVVFFARSYADCELHDGVQVRRALWRSTVLCVCRCACDADAAAVCHPPFAVSRSLFAVHEIQELR